METETKCPKCGSTFIHCPECDKEFKHGEASQCDEIECKAINAPLDCKCGLVASANLDGVLDEKMCLILYE